jgi:tetratricopeptide (TPR) repeat protein
VVQASSKWNYASRRTVRIWPNRDIGCLVSIGTGLLDTRTGSSRANPSTFRPASRPDTLTVAEYYDLLATNCEATSLRLALLLNQEQRPRYYRFNVNIPRIDLEEIDRLADVKRMVSEYFREPEHREAISNCLQLLRSEEALKAVVHKSRPDVPRMATQFQEAGRAQSPSAFEKSVSAVESFPKLGRLSLGRLQSENPDAFDLLKLLSFFDDDDIPELTLRDAACSLQLSSLQTPLASEKIFEDILKTLISYSFVQSSSGSIAVRRVLQEEIQTSLTTDERLSVFHSAVTLLLTVMPPHMDDIRSWNTVQRHYRHVIRLHELSIRYSIRTMEFARLLQHSFPCLISATSYNVCKPLLVTALLIRRESVGDNSLEMIETMLSVGEFQMMWNYFDEAEAMAEHVLKISSNKLGRFHELTIKANVLLAQCFQFEYATTRGASVMRELLSIPEEWPARPEARVCQVSTQFTIVRQEAMSAQSEEEKLRALMKIRNVIRLCENTHGTRHPKVGFMRTFLGHLYEELERNEGAKTEYAESIQLLGSGDYPNIEIIAPLLQLGVIYLNEGQLEDARKCFRLASQQVKLLKVDKKTDEWHTFLVPLVSLFLAMGTEPGSPELESTCKMALQRADEWNKSVKDPNTRALGLGARSITVLMKHISCKVAWDLVGYYGQSNGGHIKAIPLLEQILREVKEHDTVKAVFGTAATLKLLSYYCNIRDVVKAIRLAVGLLTEINASEEPDWDEVNDILGTMLEGFRNGRDSDLRQFKVSMGVARTLYRRSKADRRAPEVVTNQLRELAQRFGVK